MTSTSLLVTIYHNKKVRAGIDSNLFIMLITFDTNGRDPAGYRTPASTYSQLLRFDASRQYAVA